ncbi:cell wall protein RBR3-like [Patiria miniata]|uniref:Uncharacterized protein n=1 Tax=Patiria miniata TaxID=46514 RepID=A0A914BB82_PATMI|nr:cell wall protein RBR3-like [Patiria miniata]
MSPNNNEKEHRHLGTSSGNDLNVTTTTPKPTSISVAGSPTTGNASRQATGNEEATTSSSNLSSPESASEVSPKLSMKEKVTQHENFMRVPTAAPKPTSISLAGSPTTGNASRQATRNEKATTSSSDLSSPESPSEVSPKISVKEKVAQHESFVKVSTAASKPTSIPVAGGPTTGNASRQVTRNEETTNSSSNLSSPEFASKLSPKISVKERVAQHMQHENFVKVSTAAPTPTSIPLAGSPTTGNASRQATGNEEATTSSSDLSSPESASVVSPKTSVKEKVAQHESFVKVSTAASKPTSIPVAGGPTTGNASRQATGNEEATTSSSDLSLPESASEVSPKISVKEKVTQHENFVEVSTADPQEMSPNNNEKEHRHLETSSGNDLNVTTTTPKPTSISVAGSPTTGNASRQATGNDEATTSSSDLSSPESASEVSPKISVKEKVAQHESFVKVSTLVTVWNSAPHLEWIKPLVTGLATCVLTPMWSMWLTFHGDLARTS